MVKACVPILMAALADASSLQNRNQAGSLDTNEEFHRVLSGKNQAHPTTPSRSSVGDITDGAKCCWRSSYTRGLGHMRGDGHMSYSGGVGWIPDYFESDKCGGSQYVEINGLCYQPCPTKYGVQFVGGTHGSLLCYPPCMEGYTGDSFVCWASQCPSFTNARGITVKGVSSAAICCDSKETALETNGKLAEDAVKLIAAFAEAFFDPAKVVKALETAVDTACEYAMPICDASASFNEKWKERSCKVLEDISKIADNSEARLLQNADASTSSSAGDGDGDYFNDDATVDNNEYYNDDAADDNQSPSDDNGPAGYNNANDYNDDDATDDNQHVNGDNGDDDYYYFNDDDDGADDNYNADDYSTGDLIPIDDDFFRASSPAPTPAPLNQTWVDCITTIDAAGNWGKICDILNMSMHMDICPPVATFQNLTTQQLMPILNSMRPAHQQLMKKVIKAHCGRVQMKLNSTKVRTATPSGGATASVSTITQSYSPGGLSEGAIAGIVVGCSALGTFAAVAIMMRARSRREKTIAKDMGYQLQVDSPVSGL
jgi:hypothetical protein